MGNNSGSIIAIVIAVAAVMALMFLGSSGSLRSTAIGTDGLRYWLVSQDIEVVQANGRIERDLNEFSLRILPLNDIDFSADRRPAATERQFLLGRTQNDIDQWSVDAKIAALPSLVMLPKWRTGTYSKRLAFDQFLIFSTDVNQVLDQLGHDELEVARLSKTMEVLDARIEGGGTVPVTLYGPQVFVAKSVPAECEPVVTTRFGALVVACSAGSDAPPTFILSDPDLLNNHGLALGENAAFAVELVRALRAADARPVYLDTVRWVMLRDGDEPEQPDYERTTDDLLRFFEQPFLTFWIIALILLIVLFWRSMVRFGPLERGVQHQPDASKLAAIDAKARLLRLSGNDHRLLAEYVHNRVQTLATQVLGPFATGDIEKQLFKIINRRDKNIAAAFAAAYQAITDQPDGVSSQELFKRLSDFDLQYKRVSDAIGRISEHY